MCHIFKNDMIIMRIQFTPVHFVEGTVLRRTVVIFYSFLTMDYYFI